MFEPIELTTEAIIKVLGVGGGGCNAIEHMVHENIEGVDFLAINTDAQALRKMDVKQIIQIGSTITKGLGAGANPDVGRNSAEEDRDVLRGAIEGADMLFIAAGMGGGTGTGAAPVVASIAKDLSILTVAVVTKPFSFEGKRRMAFAEQGISELSKYVDSLIIIPNDKLLKVLGKGISLLDAFRVANDVLKGAVQGISELITHPGLMNVDFADVRTVMSEMGYAMMGTGVASGDNRAEEAAELAISSPLLEDIDLSGARGVLINITSGFDLRLDEFEIIGNTIRSVSSDNAIVVMGTSLNPDINNELRVTIVATGIGIDKPSEIMLVAGNNQDKEHGQRAVDKNHYRTPVKEYAATSLSGHSYSSDVLSQKSLSVNKNKENESDYLDIPTFLRRQID
ncbi:cell division protein FtsZ [Blochmannia endosymbiont of Polyrhachis (Hedomyrma) turneri]|nr:cell division protein FtsZ [Blochmannia endosymbiont of Polyrhachis (Hedomyrma) turneri]AKC59729.1 cell division protein FtsZ [Blochmannia endosymbiont of Polyrhachis (Hedomyrma) turneri]